MAEVEEFKKQLLSALNYKCSVCAVDLLSGAFQCDNGEHFICPKCVATKLECPFCPQGNSNRKFLPCKLITTLVSKLCSTCPHARCGQTVKPGEMEDHKKACPWRPWNFCSMLNWPSCQAMPIIETPVHLTQVHMMPTCKLDYGRFHDIKNLLLETDKSHVFVLKLPAGMAGTPAGNWWDAFILMHREKELVKFFPYFRGSAEEASKFQLNIQFTSTHSSSNSQVAALAWNGPLGNWDTDMKDALSTPWFSNEHFKTLANIAKNDDSANKFHIGIFSRAQGVEHNGKRPSDGKEDRPGKKMNLKSPSQVTTMVASTSSCQTA